MTHQTKQRAGRTVPSEPDAYERLWQRMLEIGIGAAREEADWEENQNEVVTSSVPSCICD